MKKKWLLASGLAIVVGVAIIIIRCSVVDKQQEIENLDSLLDLSVSVHDKSGDLIYDKEFQTTEKFLVDALKSLEDLDLVIQDDKYGAYVTSIKGIEQGDNYYWTYYVNDEYASSGISSYEVKNDDKILFKIEQF